MVVRRLMCWRKKTGSIALVDAGEAKVGTEDPIMVDSPIRLDEGVGIDGNELPSMCEEEQHAMVDSTIRLDEGVGIDGNEIPSMFEEEQPTMVDENEGGFDWYEDLDNELFLRDENFDENYEPLGDEVEGEGDAEDGRCYMSEGEVDDDLGPDEGKGQGEAEDEGCLTTRKKKPSKGVLFNRYVQLMNPVLTPTMIFGSAAEFRELIRVYAVKTKKPPRLVDEQENKMNIKGIVSPNVIKVLKEREKRTHEYITRPSGSPRYDITSAKHSFVVDVENVRVDCGSWDPFCNLLPPELHVLQGRPKRCWQKDETELREVAEK
ncbi:hypothetical protein LIER_32998 [Lithospermum erythrorhizon]|uniref:Uncharacterized protein n=1 Tax=Lithospermum erythrorhizon TaxID=34254 RepID=A0AAV3RXY3_LITER